MAEFHFSTPYYIERSVANAPRRIVAPGPAELYTHLRRQGSRPPTHLHMKPQRHRGTEEGKVTSTFQQLRPDFPINPDVCVNSFPAQSIEYLVCVSVPLWFIFQSAPGWQDVYNVQRVPPSGPGGFAHLERVNSARR